MLTLPSLRLPSIFLHSIEFIISKVSLLDTFLLPSHEDVNHKSFINRTVLTVTDYYLQVFWDDLITVWELNIHNTSILPI